MDQRRITNPYKFFIIWFKSLASLFSPSSHSLSMRIPAIMAEPKTVTLNCLCGQSRASYKPPSENLELQLCHCSICRHQSGLPCAFLVQIPPSCRDTFVANGPFSAFNTSSQLTRHFCSICGANVYITDREGKVTDVCAGVLDRPQLLQSVEQIYCSSTKDGGISPWFAESTLWSEDPDTSKKLDPSDLNLTSTTSINDKKGSIPLPCHCQCKAVSFRISHPPKDTTSFPSNFSAGPYSDLLIPYHVNDSRQSNPENDPWFLRTIPTPDTSDQTISTTRYLAGLCACQSCRRASGALFQSWTFIPRHLLLSATNDEVLDIDSLRQPSDPAKGRMLTYQSSQGTYRDFCSNCGATVFWRSDKRADVFDVSTGLLDAGGDVRAERWLSWCTDRVSFEEEAEGEEVLRRLKEGLASWKGVTEAIDC